MGVAIPGQSAMYWQYICAGGMGGGMVAPMKLIAMAGVCMEDLWEPCDRTGGWLLLMKPMEVMESNRGRTVPYSNGPLLVV